VAQEARDETRADAGRCSTKERTRGAVVQLFVVFRALRYDETLPGMSRKSVSEVGMVASAPFKGVELSAYEREMLLPGACQPQSPQR
jgi:hypothetical protein